MIQMREGFSARSRFAFLSSNPESVREGWCSKSGLVAFAAYPERFPSELLQRAAMPRPSDASAVRKGCCSWLHGGGSASPHEDPCKELEAGSDKTYYQKQRQLRFCCEAQSVNRSGG